MEGIYGGGGGNVEDGDAGCVIEGYGGGGGGVGLGGGDGSFGVFLDDEGAGAVVPGIAEGGC